MVEKARLYHFLFLFVILILTILSILFVKNKNEKIRYRFNMGLLLSGFLLHFIKLFFEPYRSNFPYSISKITFENICAFNIITFPFIYRSNNRHLKDYMILVGLIGGIGSIVTPYQVTGFTEITFDVLRFYYAHMVLYLVPLLMLCTKEYKLSFKSMFFVPITFFGVELVILANEIILYALGIIEGTMDNLFDPQFKYYDEFRNAHLIFGPNPGASFYRIVYEPLIPDLFKTVPFGTHKGETRYWPFIWLVIPSFIYLPLVGGILCLIFNVLLKEKHPVRETNEENKIVTVGNI